MVRKPPAETSNLYEAKINVSRLVDRAAAGEEIVIAKGGRPLARLVPWRDGPPRARSACWKARGWIGADFNDLLPEAMAAAIRG